MTIQEWNDLGLSLCTVPQSPVICCGHVFWSSGMLSEGMVNLGVMELRGIQQRGKALQGGDLMTLVCELGNYNVLVEHLYQSWNRSGGTSVLVYIVVLQEQTTQEVRGGNSKENEKKMKINIK